jgi:hypothetical protein
MSKGLLNKKIKTHISDLLLNDIPIALSFKKSNTNTFADYYLDKLNEVIKEKDFFECNYIDIAVEFYYSELMFLMKQAKTYEKEIVYISENLPNDNIVNFMSFTILKEILEPIIGNFYKTTSKKIKDFKNFLPYLLVVGINVEIIRTFIEGYYNSS